MMTVSLKVFQFSPLIVLYSSISVNKPEITSAACNFKKFKLSQKINKGPDKQRFGMWYKLEKHVTYAATKLEVANLLGLMA